MYEEMRKLAEKWHAGQTRNAREGEPEVPYFEHPKAVVQNLLDWGEPEDSPAIGIAWGHDLREDTDVTEEEIHAASDETVLNGIRLLTHAKETPKPLYIRNVANSGDRNAILVKISDRIQNSRDFARWPGALRAFRYLHDADCIFEAIQKLPQDTVLSNAIVAWQELDESLREDARHDAIRGCMLGGAVGDALGAPVEFKSIENIKAQYGPQGITGYVEFPDGTGSITDDTQMALFTAEGLIMGPPPGGFCCVRQNVYYAYLRWLKTQGGRIPAGVPENVLDAGRLIHEKPLFARRAPGVTCLTALESGNDAGTAANDSKGCGTVMRMAPVGLDSPCEMAYNDGCVYSALTHGHPTGITAGGAFAMLIAELLNGKSLEDALDLVMDELTQDKDATETLAALRKAQTAKQISELGQGWVAEEALAIGVYCALKYTWNFRKAVLEAVNITGDSDSTGSITGNIVGVINGEKSIPSEWLSHLREREIVSQVADDLWTGYEEDADGHTTKEWWDKYPGF